MNHLADRPDAYRTASTIEVQSRGIWIKSKWENPKKVVRGRKMKMIDLRLVMRLSRLVRTECTGNFVKYAYGIGLDDMIRYRTISM